MTAFMLQALLLLVIAFLLGLFIGLFIKRMLCKPDSKVIRPVEQKADSDTEHTGILNQQALTGAVVAGAAATTGMVAAQAKMGDIKDSLPEVDVDTTTPTVDTNSQEVDAKAPDVETATKVDVPDVATEAELTSVATPTIKLPVVQIDEEDADTLAVGATPETTDSGEVEMGLLHRTGSSQVKLPQIKAELAEPIASTEPYDDAAIVHQTKASDSTVKLPVVKASGFVGTDIEEEVAELPVVSASGSVGTYIEEVTELPLVSASGSVGTDQHTPATSQLDLTDIPAIRAAMSEQSTKSSTQTLWNASEGKCRCQDLNGEDKVLLNTGCYGKVGSIHCGVARAGFIAVGGHVSNIDDGQAILFINSKVVACRSGDNYTFVSFTGL